MNEMMETGKRIVETGTSFVREFRGKPPEPDFPMTADDWTEMLCNFIGNRCQAIKIKIRVMEKDPDRVRNTEALRIPIEIDRGHHRAMLEWAGNKMGCPGWAGEWEAFNKMFAAFLGEG